MLGLEKGVVELSSHKEQWHRIFTDEAALLSEAIGQFVIAIEHIGSTCICGISAKPILDIGVAISDQANGEKCIAPLKKIGYQFRGENGIAGRFYFVKGTPRTHHLHMHLSESEAWGNHLFFRDHLRQNPQKAKAYDRLKKELSQKYKNDRESYLKGKADFIEKILKSAGSKENLNEIKENL